MKAAIFQTEIKFENKEENLDKALHLIEKAALSGADIAFFPEMSFTGFSMNIALTGETDDYTINMMAAAAKKYAVNIGFGYVKLHENKGENHYTVIGTDGEVISDYIKIHSFAIGGEREDFRSGNDLPLPFSLCSHHISTFICYDLRFPEIFRAAADRSTIMTVAANWPASRREHWLTLLRARAIENQVYIIGINCTGDQAGIHYSGDSIVIDPSGNIISQAGSGAEDMLICDIEANTDKIRSDFPVLKSRKPDLYIRLLTER